MFSAVRKRSALSDQADSPEFRFDLDVPPDDS